MSTFAPILGDSVEDTYSWATSKEVGVHPSMIGRELAPIAPVLVNVCSAHRLKVVVVI
jgi:hypothetical protein